GVFYHGAHLPIGDDHVLPEAWQTDQLVIRHIYLGGFGRNYDFQVMARVIEALGQDARHHFFLVGAGSEQQKALKTRLAGLPNVTFTDWLPREEAYRLARSCHLGWLPLKQ